MCTSLSMNNGGFCFGRNMDIEFDFRADVVITPRRYPLGFCRAGSVARHYAMIGTAMVADGYPLYADAMNEKGLCIAGLSFPESVIAEASGSGKEVSPFELIPWVLSQCADIGEARKLLERTVLVGVPFSTDIPLTPLHWHIADKSGSLVLESTAEGMNIYDDPVGVLTNSPPFPFHQTNLRQYLNLTSAYPEVREFAGVRLSPFGRGFGLIGLPGDFSPPSRYVRTAFLKVNSPQESDEGKRMMQFFHILDNVAMPRGSVKTADGREEYTDYSCCMSGSAYCFRSYYDSMVCSVDMLKEDLDATQLKVYTKGRELLLRQLN